MKRFLSYLLVLLLTAPLSGYAQSKFMTKAGKVSFFSTSIIEDIEAHNTTAASVVDVGGGQLAFSIAVKEFTFKRTLMQEHFNENYMESEKFPRATFSGRFTGLDLATLTTPGLHTVSVEGDLLLHGVTRHITVQGTMELKSGQLLVFSYFSVAPADYNIEIPLLVRENIAKIVSIRVALSCAPVNAGGAAAQ